jgi:hypothetical protein
VWRKRCTRRKNDGSTETRGFPGGGQPAKNTDDAFADAWKLHKAQKATGVSPNPANGNKQKAQKAGAVLTGTMNKGVKVVKNFVVSGFGKLEQLMTPNVLPHMVLPHMGGGVSVNHRTLPVAASTRDVGQSSATPKRKTMTAADRRRCLDNYFAIQNAKIAKK